MFIPQFTSSSSRRRMCFLCLLLVLALTQAKPLASQDGESGGMRVYLTLSSLANTSMDGVVTQRQFEFNWYNDVSQADDWVGLFDHDPAVDLNNPLEQIQAVDYPDNYFRSSFMFPRPNLDDISLETQCLGYWIGYIRQGALVASNCIKIQPHWMWNIRQQISHLRLTGVMIPGTHDAGSHKEYVAYESDNYFTRWYVTQDESFWEQLVYGIRHFDLRLAYYPEEEEQFWVEHGQVIRNPFSEAVEAYKKFLNQTKEILILDFHQFPAGFQDHPERHVQLQNYLIQQLGPYILPPSVGYDVTLDTIWRSDKRVVIAYSDAALSNYPGLLWSGIPQIWADTTDLDYLRSYMQGYMDSGRRDIWSAQLEFTPHDSDKLLTYSSLRVLAQEVNRNVTQWCRDLWWDKANLAAEDFFLGSNIVEVAIEANLKRSQQLNNTFV